MISTTSVESHQKIQEEWFRAGLKRVRTCFDGMTSAEFTTGLLRVAAELAGRLSQGGTIYWCGNGGSSSDSQHLAAELMGRFGRPGPGWPSVALTADSSVLTATGNDFGFDSVFERQVRVLVRPFDGVVGISTSGASGNVIAAITEARRKGALTVALTGPNDSPLAQAAELVIRAPGGSTSEVQTCHIAIGQMLCEAAIELAESWEERNAA